MMALDAVHELKMLLLITMMVFYKDDVVMIMMMIENGDRNKFGEWH